MHLERDTLLFFFLLPYLIAWLYPYTPMHLIPKVRCVAEGEGVIAEGEGVIAEGEGVIAEGEGVRGTPQAKV